MQQKRLVIAGTSSGAGKTTITIGLMAAFKQMGYTVQGFKCGPDYIDPSYHTAVTGRVSRNLDSWMLPHDTVKEIFAKASRDADVSVIEGVMGFYDGKNPESNVGSTAEISIITGSPVVLVVDCLGMARSAAAVVKGFQYLSPEVNIVGVIANRVGSHGHYSLIGRAVEQECGIPVLGYLKREAGIEIPERHLGLVPSVERGELDNFFQKLGELISQTVDLERLLELMNAEPLKVETRLFNAVPPAKKVRIAVAKDEAFNFYYPENIELLESCGAEYVYFSPLHGQEVPENVDGLYIGGGFPEEFARQLAGQTQVQASIRKAVSAGLPTLAECGGFMYLTQEIETADGECYPMVGVIPGKVKMQSKLAALGYREITGTEGNFLLGPADQAKGHEFHYSTFIPGSGFQPAYITKGLRGTHQEGYVCGNLVAGYTHLHFASAPDMTKRWVNKCLEVKEKRYT